jgi:hypothetical protein
VASEREKINAYRLHVGKYEGKDRLVDLGIDGRIKKR